jgi:hypothetical protein
MSVTCHFFHPPVGSACHSSITASWLEFYVSPHCNNIFNLIKIVQFFIWDHVWDFLINPLLRVFPQTAINWNVNYYILDEVYSCNIVWNWVCTCNVCAQVTVLPRKATGQKWLYFINQPWVLGTWPLASKLGLHSLLSLFPTRKLVDSTIIHEYEGCSPLHFKKIGV